LYTQEFAELDESSQSSVVEIFACINCGMVFSDLGIEQCDLDKEYENSSKYADMSIYAIGDETEESDEAPFDLRRLEGTVDWLNETFDRRDLRVLDAGCATGSLLGYLKASGWTELVGLDPSSVATVAARKVHEVDARPGVVHLPARRDWPV
jgi:SAM-dependent methyltransferase